MMSEILDNVTFILSIAVVALYFLAGFITSRIVLKDTTGPIADYSLRYQVYFIVLALGMVIFWPGMFALHITQESGFGEWDEKLGLVNDACDSFEALKQRQTKVFLNVRDDFVEQLQRFVKMFDDEFVELWYHRVFG